MVPLRVQSVSSSNLRDVCDYSGDTHTGAVQVAVPFMCWHSAWHSTQVLFSTIASRGSLRKTNKTGAVTDPGHFLKRLHVRRGSPSPFRGHKLNCKHPRIQYLTEICQDKQVWVNVPSRLRCLSQIFRRFRSKYWIVFGLRVASKANPQTHLLSGSVQACGMKIDFEGVKCSAHADLMFGLFVCTKCGTLGFRAL